MTSSGETNASFVQWCDKTKGDSWFSWSECLSKLPFFFRTTITEGKRPWLAWGQRYVQVMAKTKHARIAHQLLHIELSVSLRLFPASHVSPDKTIEPPFSCSVTVTNNSSGCDFKRSEKINKIIGHTAGERTIPSFLFSALCPDIRFETHQFTLVTTGGFEAQPTVSSEGLSSTVLFFFQVCPFRFSC